MEGDRVISLVGDCRNFAMLWWEHFFCKWDIENKFLLGRGEDFCWGGRGEKFLLESCILSRLLIIAHILSYFAIFCRQ